MKKIKTDVVVIGAGLTGLTTAFHLSRRGIQVQVLERNDYAGGQIRTFREQGFVYESGPNTGVVSYPEVAELFAALGPSCELEAAREDAKRRLIWKGNRFHELPSGPVSAVTTPLFRLSDKFRILLEPFRPKGTDPDESVAALARRRLGRSFVDYAVDPFLSGVYAGNPQTLITRYALPKLYNLEQTYGSFIKGSIAKSREPKPERDKLATKQVFSARGGLDHLPQALARQIGEEHIFLGARDIAVHPAPDGIGWLTACRQGGEPCEVRSRYVVTTVGAYSLPALLPFVDKAEMDCISNLVYAAVIQASVGITDTCGKQFNAFGGLVPSREKRDVLGILFPSACFVGRAPEGGALFSFFMGGRMREDLFRLSDAEIEAIILRDLHEMLKLPAEVQPAYIRLFRHEKAIPQYEKSSGDRLRAVSRIEQQYPGLIVAGNLRDGIGMADRIRQGTTVANTLAAALQ